MYRIILNFYRIGFVDEAVDRIFCSDHNGEAVSRLHSISGRIEIYVVVVVFAFAK